MTSPILASSEELILSSIITMGADYLVSILNAHMATNPSKNELVAMLENFSQAALTALSVPPATTTTAS